MCPYFLFFEVWKYYFRNSRSVSNCTQYSVTLFQNLIKGQQGPFAQIDSIRTAQKRTRQPSAWELVLFFIFHGFIFHIFTSWKSEKVGSPIVPSILLHIVPRFYPEIVICWKDLLKTILSHKIYVRSEFLNYSKLGFIHSWHSWLEYTLSLVSY